MAVAGMQSSPTQQGSAQIQNYGPGQGLSTKSTSAAPDEIYNSSPQQASFPSVGAVGPSQLPPTPASAAAYPQSSTPTATAPGERIPVDLPPLKPVFGVSLDDLFKRDGSAVPMVIYQCLQAVDLFGLDVEGIYRLSGSASHVMKLRGIFDNGEKQCNRDIHELYGLILLDSSQVDFRNPETFFHDVNSVAGLLKQFFRDLPDPLLTREHYQGFIEAARRFPDLPRLGPF